MPLQYEKPKGSRLKRYFLDIHTDQNYWYNCDLRRWEHQNEVEWGKHIYSNCASCKTVRAFRRHLRKNPEMKGKLRLVNRYIGYDVFG